MPRALSTRRAIMRSCRALGRVTVEAATISGEHAAPWNALRRFRIDVDRAELEAGVVAVYPVLDVEDEESTATRAAKAEAVVAHDHVRPEVLTRPGSDESDRAEVEAVIRRAYPSWR
jgi:hypothetical protein